MAYRNPTPTVDVVVHRIHNDQLEVLLIERANPPHGWALPGGFVDEGERVETAAIREVEEETGIQVQLDQLLYVYSDPKRDLRQHNLSIVFTSDVTHQVVEPKGQDDANEAQFFPVTNLPRLVFDHGEIISDFLAWITESQLPHPQEKLNDVKS